ncbi:STAS domain-containing protein [Psychroserpens sp. Hel_I_66]|uniref:STAS domain-containing protein n=1 Tax=Psychroserpens sp. Hel_I_66 TaxID=1250004 RepID=UPI000647B6AE|nr:STAS domain-containing protein [Psychroserpens sp. Hel_I_66]
MALQITRNEKTFTVEGKINTSTASNFKTHFVITLNSLTELTIDISKVTEIDSDGVEALKTIYRNAISWNKPFSIIGYGCKEIYDELRLNAVA